MNIHKHILAVGVLLTFLPQTHADPAKEKVIDTVVIRIDPNVVPAGGEQTVHCPSPYKGFCACTINNIVSTRPKDLTLHVTPNGAGSSYLSNGTNNIECVHKPWNVISPYLALLQAIYGKENILKVIYTDGTRASKAELEAINAPANPTRTSVAGISQPVKEDELNLHSNERRLMQTALHAANGDTAIAAKKLGISEKALLRKMKDEHL